MANSLVGKKSSLLIALAAIVLAFGLFLVIPDRSNPKPDANACVQVADQACYEGVEGKNALELLKSAHTTETTTSSFGEYVNSIDGKKPESNQFWAFYVNGELAQVGAGDYQTKSGDVIVWKLDTIQ